MISAMRTHGVQLCTGVDSHVVTDLIEDMRALETHERLRTKSRVTFMPSSGTPALALWNEASHGTARACGFADAGGTLLVDRNDRSLALVAEDRLVEAIVFSGSSRLVLAVQT
jgi:formimidoylglutamate deiminase